VWTRPAPRNPNVTEYVARVGGDLAGFVELVRHPPEHFPYVGHWLFSLHVWTRFRGLGIGALLTRQVMEQAQRKGARELLLVVFADNAPAIHLYRKLGFVPIAAPAFDEQFAREPRPRIVMCVNLQSGEPS
jgi:ribosomal protein S18 acetylase RimI-like enzyme